ncbi:hypothetical protein PIB30_044338 [Stylosanthes scabra]|uniref:DUF7086 domain-containing protein n=1 Tax=Stylosanthes scabra TaxID=79078 RepID=A0ABU6QFS3_9FABA|nr:hypothetical protein [Stylosanthes scabra]
MEDHPTSHNQWLTLSLSLPSPFSPTHSSSLVMLSQHQELAQPSKLQAARRRAKKATKKTTKTATVPQPFPWATTKRTIVHTLEHLFANKIISISGTVECKACQKQYDMQFNLQEKFHEVERFILRKIQGMHDRAPHCWMNPALSKCGLCDNTMVPMMPKRKRNINWLFLFLGQMIGCCSHYQLKYFNSHQDIISTVAKNRLVYLVYLGLNKQLKPPFDL